jgi:hypothetical protein
MIVTNNNIIISYNGSIIDYTTPIVLNGLVLYLDAGNPLSYPGTGTIWNDLSNFGNNGTLINGPTFNSGNGGNIVFDGTNDFVNCGTGVGKPVNFTISTWIKPNAWNNCGIVFSTNGQPLNHWGLWGRVNGNFEVYVSNGSSFQGANTSLPWSSVSIPNSGFTNITITVDGSLIKIFKNSLQVGGNLTQTIQQVGSSNNLLIGQTAADSGYYYNGSVAEVLVYNRALSSTEILENYNATKSRFGL